MLGVTEYDEDSAAGTLLREYAHEQGFGNMALAASPLLMVVPGSTRSRHRPAPRSIHGCWASTLSWSVIRRSCD
jgi:hypothetical protein